MKKIKLLIILLISIFICNTKVFAASATLSVTPTNVYVGDTFTVNVNMKDAAAWNIHVTSTGPVDNTACIINEADASDDAKNIDKTFKVTCTATGEGTVRLTLSGDVSSEASELVNLSGSKIVTVSKKPTSTTTTTTTTTKKIDDTETTSTTTITTTITKKNIDESITTNPKTGVNKYIILVIIILFITSIVLIVRYKKYDKDKSEKDSK